MSTWEDRIWRLVMITLSIVLLIELERMPHPDMNPTIILQAPPSSPASAVEKPINKPIVLEVVEEPRSAK